MNDELAELVADLKATLEDAASRGQWAEPVEAVAPVAAASVPKAAAVPKTAAVAKVPPPVGAWAKIADAARQAGDRAPMERRAAELGVVPGAEGMARIRDDLGDCQRCGLCKERRNIVFGVGDAEADLVVVGEGPGHDEDRTGEPFVGPAGQMLDKMLAHVLGLARERVYICNVVKCRPPGNRNPLPDEVAACRPFLERQILAARPKVLLVLGSVALKALLDSPHGIMRSRGVWTEWSGIPVMPTFHPAYLLRNPDDKRKTFEDLKVLRQRYDELGGRR